MCFLSSMFVLTCSNQKFMYSYLQDVRLRTNKRYWAFLVSLNKITSTKTNVFFLSVISSTLTEFTLQTTFNNNPISIAFFRFKPSDKIKHAYCLPRKIRFSNLVPTTFDRGSDIKQTTFLKMFPVSFKSKSHCAIHFH